MALGYRADGRHLKRVAKAHQFPYFPGRSRAQTSTALMCRCRTAFERTFPELYRFEYGVEGDELGNVEPGVDF
jgi:hypothetical protein